MVTVIWSELSIEDLRNIFEYIALDSPYYAGLQIDRIVNRTEQLIEFPQSGRVVPEFNNVSLRELIEGNYRIIYQLENETVEIVRIHHAAKKID
jgi:addiction module RelE/StbE family toxin